MRFKPGILIREDEDGYFFAGDGTKQGIPKQYEAIIKAIKNGVTEETAMIGELSQNGMPETEASLLCAEFIMDFSDVLETEK